MNKILRDIVKNIDFELLSGTLDLQISGISFDSRKTKIGHLFIAVQGMHSDGHAYIPKAIENGAVAVIIDKKLIVDEKITIIKTDDSSKALGKSASNFYNNPSEKIHLVGITGTNGKTTTATLLYKLFKSLGHKAGLISTVKNLINDKEIKALYTTPDALSFNSMLNDMVEEGCEYCFAEVSSHAVAQKRIEGLTFKGAVFTNITHDHLDYHKTFSEYLKVKKEFFDSLPKNAFAVSNIDDKNGQVMLQNTNAEKYTYALKSFADFKTKVIEKHIDGMLLNTNEKEYWTLLTGTFNAYNLTAVYAAAILLGKSENDVLTALSNLKAVDGRFDTITVGNKTAIIDYAHTPDALKNVISTINEIRKKDQALITIVGTGGDRDKAKRPIMAQVAVSRSSKVILTSDNPRTEDPESIIQDMLKGLDKDQELQIIKITDREEAIKTGIMLAENGDIILIAGKGHEDYQEIKGIRKHFDDKEIAKKYLDLLNK